MSDTQRTISEIIEAAGGPIAVAAASGGLITVDAIYKWPKIGIRDVHWPVVMLLAGATPSEMLAANLAARSSETRRVA